MNEAIEAVFSGSLSGCEAREPVESQPVPEVEGAAIHHNVFNQDECKVLRTAIAELHKHANSKRPDDAINRRDSQYHVPHLVSPTHMPAVSERLRPLLPPHAAQGGLPLAPAGSDVSSFFRTYFYNAGDTSKPHYDRSFTERNDDGNVVQFSAYSILIYLGPDECEGGATTFFKHDPRIAMSRNRLTPLGNRSVLKVNVSVQPRTGSVLVFPHGEYVGCAPNPLHEGSLVVAGSKGLIRTDAVYVGTPALRAQTLGQGGAAGMNPKSKKERKERRKQKQVPAQAKRIYDALVEAAAAVCPSVDPAVDLDPVRVVKLTGRRAGPELLCTFGTVAYWALYRMEQHEREGREQSSSPSSSSNNSDTQLSEPESDNITKQRVWTASDVSSSLPLSSSPPLPPAATPNEQKPAKRAKGPASAHVTVVSSMGTVRVLSPVQLASALVDAIPADVREEVMPFVRVNPESGVIAINTTEFLTQSLAQGLVLCQLCGAFVKSHNSGLTWHMKSAHGLENHHDASAAVAVSEQALMALRPPPSQFGARSGNVGDAGTAGDGDGDVAAAHVRQAELKSADMTKAQSDPAVLAEMISAGRVKALSAPLDACRAGDLDALVAHVQDGGWNPALETDSNGSTALLWAAGGGHLSCVQYLVNECGMDASAGARARRGYAGRTALHWAARNGHAQTLEWLLSPHGGKVDVNVVTDEGTTAFCLACWQGHKAACEVLLQHGADPHLKNSFGCGAGLWAVQGGCDLPFLQFLYNDCGVSLDYLNNNKHSALHKAAQRGLQEVCEWLVHTVGLKDCQYFQESHDERSTPATLARFTGAEGLADWLATFEQQGQRDETN